jgi:hypothetical protein
MNYFYERKTIIENAIGQYENLSTKKIDIDNLLDIQAKLRSFNKKENDLTIDMGLSYIDTLIDRKKVTKEGETISGMLFQKKKSFS